MQDLKHITKRKRFIRISFPGRKQNASVNAFKNLNESPAKRRRLKFLLPLLAIVLASYPIFHLLVSARTAISSIGVKGPQDTRKPRVYKDLDNWQSFQLAATALPTSQKVGDTVKASLPEGGTVLYPFDEQLQHKVEKVLSDYKVPYGVFVAVEPKTGRILAMASSSAIDPEWTKYSYYNLYPMASLFKIITAAAALEQKKVLPETVFAYRGKGTSENPKYWYLSSRHKNQEMPLTTAMGKSVNPVFGRLASDVVGKDTLVSYTERFGFNQQLFPGTPATPSKSVVPQTDQELKLMGAGLGREVKISPLHAAAVMAAVANDGMMMAPGLAQEIRNEGGSTVFTHQPLPLRRIVTPETAQQLSKMLSTTVITGTSRKAFHDRRGRPKLASVKVAAKTGSIDGKEPVGHYSWFAAYAPIEDPQIALVALVVNQSKWRIKASHVGEQALEAFFK
jgi:cell division protein FtsI/penicillin-binding protein 2